MSFTKTLSRDEMKNVMAGFSGDCGGGTCLYCHNPGGGYEGWYRDDTSEDADSECGDIYGSDAIGSYQECGSHEDHGVQAPVYCN